MLKEKPIPHFFVDVKSLSSEDSMVQLCHPLPIFEVMAWVRMQVLGCLLAVDFAKKGYRWNMMKCSWLSGESALQNLEFWCPQGFPQRFPQGNSRGTLANVCSTFVVWFPKGFPSRASRYRCQWVSSQSTGQVSRVSNWSILWHIKYD